MTRFWVSKPARTPDRRRHDTTCARGSAFSAASSRSVSGAASATASGRAPPAPPRSSSISTGPMPVEPRRADVAHVTQPGPARRQVPATPPAASLLAAARGAPRTSATSRSVGQHGHHRNTRQFREQRARACRWATRARARLCRPAPPPTWRAYGGVHRAPSTRRRGEQPSRGAYDRTRPERRPPPRRCRAPRWRCAAPRTAAAIGRLRSARHPAQHVRILDRVGLAVERAETAGCGKSASPIRRAPAGARRAPPAGARCRRCRRAACRSLPRRRARLLTSDDRGHTSRRPAGKVIWAHPARASVASTSSSTAARICRHNVARTAVGMPSTSAGGTAGARRGSPPPTAERVRSYIRLAAAPRPYGRSAVRAARSRPHAGAGEPPRSSARRRACSRRRPGGRGRGQGAASAPGVGADPCASGFSTKTAAPARGTVRHGRWVGRRAHPHGIDGRGGKEHVERRRPPGRETPCRGGRAAPGWLSPRRTRAPGSIESTAVCRRTCPVRRPPPAPVATAGRPPRAPGGEEEVEHGRRRAALSEQRARASRRRAGPRR